MKTITILLVLIISIQFYSCQKERVNTAKQIIDKQKVVFTHPPKKIPVPHAIDAPMMGNGYTGIAISGKPEKQVFYVARNDFWRLKHGYTESFPAILGKIEIDIPELEGATYHVTQKLYEAKTYAVFKKDETKVKYCTYVSASEDLMIIELSLSGEKSFKGKVRLSPPGENEQENKPPFNTIAPSEVNTDIDKGVLWLSRAFNEDVDIPTKSAIALNILHEPSNTFVLSPGKKVIIACAFSGNFKSDNCVKTVLSRLENIEESDVKEAEKKHIAWWKNYWSESYVNINDSVIEKQYYLSNYGMASFSRDKDFPPSIFGTCITKERPSWSGDYHLNYNHFAPYYGLFSSNHIEQAIPCNIPVLAQQERGEYYSEKVSGIKNGIMLPVGAGPLGIETTRRNELMEKYRARYIEEGNVEDEGLFFGQKSNSAYCVVNMAQHFYSTYNREYTEKYYPFVKGVATFWQNYLTFENGRYVIYNDAIHEGTVGTMNPILSLGLVRLVMQTAIDMSRELNVDAERAEKWQHIFDHLSDYTYQERKGKKVFRYTERGTEWWNSNTLGIQHIYPAGQVHLGSDPEILKVAHNTIDVMQRWIDFNGSNSFFPAAVRVGYNPDTIMIKMRQYCKNTYPNGYQQNNPHGIENYSTVPNTINEMLCMGHGGILRVFPVWPKDKDASFSNLRTYGAFLVSAEQKSGQVLYVNITSEKGKQCTIKNPWPGMKVRLISDNNRDELLEGEVITFHTSENEKIKLSI